jgi:hypothetical protein
MRFSTIVVLIVTALSLASTADAQKSHSAKSKVLVGGEGSSHKGGHYVPAPSASTSPSVETAPRLAVPAPRSAELAPIAKPAKSTARTIAKSVVPVTTPRNGKGKIARSEEAKRTFEKLSGHPNGWPGHVVDHKVPLACGGADSPSNMQWQTVEEGKAKDKVERIGCGRR